MSDTTALPTQKAPLTPLPAAPPSGPGAAGLFRYFDDPRRFSTFQPRPERCDLCGETRPGYADSFYSDPDGLDIGFVCEPDLAAGRLGEAGAQVNNGDRFGLMEQAAQAHPHWSAQELDAYVIERSRELELATPSIVTWSDYEWLAHCGDYAKFIKEIGRADCARLAGEGDTHGRAFFEAALARAGYLPDEDDDGEPLVPPTGADQGDEMYEANGGISDANAGVGELWTRMRPDAPVDNSQVTATSFYLFQCSVCREYLIDWDAEGVEASGLADAGQT